MNPPFSNIEPLLSVIVPCYNHGQYLDDAIQSVLNAKSAEVVEIIIVNDGSTDDFTLKKIAELEQIGFKVLHQENQGLGYARNNGIAIARGEFILILDSDNKISKDFISNSLPVFDADPLVGVVYGNKEYFGNRIGYQEVLGFDLLRILSGNYIDACSIIRKQVFDVGLYDPDRRLSAYSDWDLWIRVGKSKWGFHHLQQLTFYYRVESNSMTGGMKDDYGKHLEVFKYLVNKHFDSYAYIIHEFAPLRDQVKKLERNHASILSFFIAPLRTFRVLFRK